MQIILCGNKNINEFLIYFIDTRINYTLFKLLFEKDLEICIISKLNENKAC